MKRDHFFVVYDFEKDSRRARCVKILEKYGVRVQYSIFEFLLTRARKIEMLAKLQRKKFLESVRGEAMMIVPISQDSARKIQRFGATVDVLDKPGVFAI